MLHLRRLQHGRLVLLRLHGAPSRCTLAHDWPRDWHLEFLCIAQGLDATPRRPWSCRHLGVRISACIWCRRNSARRRCPRLPAHGRCRKLWHLAGVIRHRWFPPSVRRPTRVECLSIPANSATTAKGDATNSRRTLSIPLRRKLRFARTLTGIVKAQCYHSRLLRRNALHDGLLLRLAWPSTSAGNGRYLMTRYPRLRVGSLRSNPSWTLGLSGNANTPWSLRRLMRQLNRSRGWHRRYGRAFLRLRLRRWRTLLLSGFKVSREAQWHGMVKNRFTGGIKELHVGLAEGICSVLSKGVILRDQGTNKIRSKNFSYVEAHEA